MRCGDEFGLEINWNGALNTVLLFCGGIAAWQLACFKCLLLLRAGVTSESSM